ncbi:D-amino-acid oxidase [Streptomyces olivoverticillatus]|uniref:D-amino-acid oxidase n=1 Tax=Streptomyces olivoverticillatus TaxID=66427 RepID=A0A7W7LSP8_9ACTN|nr:FAD-dependent oxidoreductase [Streptomyces olivoverticillatus]MBB4895342.1 D-amino-acid oxidase [Streptomyces olivoverticillatus]
MASDVIVVGAGVTGLTSAVVLAERGLRVEVWTRSPSAETTSAVAGGLWWPYRIRPEAQASAWALRSLAVLAGLAERPEETGVRMVEGTHGGAVPAELGPWAEQVRGLRAAEPEELPRGYDRGVRCRLPLLDMPAHLDYLRRRLAAAGGTVTVRPVASLGQAGRAAGAVVNCTGLGARDLVPDYKVYPVRGQVVVVENPGIDEWFTVADDSKPELLYVLPQPYGVVLGGTAGEHVWDRTPSPCTAQAIIARCSRVHPRLCQSRVLAHRVGLRPARHRVRLEAERLPGGARLVHNYGHGGAGITVSWGCALQTADLVEL